MYLNIYSSSVLSSSMIDDSTNKRTPLNDRIINLSKGKHNNNWKDERHIYLDHLDIAAVVARTRIGCAMSCAVSRFPLSLSLFLFTHIPAESIKMRERKQRTIFHAKADGE